MPPVLSAVLLASALHAGGDGDAQRVPVLVELFTSEGCSSCPPADAVLKRLLEEQPVAGARVIALGEHVDYWNDLGWTDPFSSRAFSERQAAYVARLAVSAPYTPELVVGGRAQLLGSDFEAARRAISAASRSTEGEMSLRVAARSSRGVLVYVEARWAEGVAAQVVLALVQDRATSTVSRGENAGRTLDHVAIARSLATIGAGRGAFSATAPLDAPARAGMRAVAFVQERVGGRVLAVDSVDLGS